jgi:hypothetical protein
VEKFYWCGAVKFCEDWLLKRNEENYLRHVTLLKKSWTGDVLPSDEFLFWQVKKKGDFYEI